MDNLVPDQIPPPPGEGSEYEYSPVPPQSKPPIGPKYMMHMWHCKEEVPDKDFFCKRFPKKKNTPCSFAWEDGPASNLGWGLHFVEAWNVSLTVWTLFAFTLTSGLAFGISWSILKDDISGAYTVASYITALTTFFLMAIMSAIAGI